MEKKSVKAQVLEFLAESAMNGFTASFRNQVVTVSKKFPVGDSAAFCDADMKAPHLLRKVSVIKSNSSVWGTDGGSVGGYAAIKNGQYVLNISGVKKSFLAEMEKQLKPYEWMG